MKREELGRLLRDADPAAVLVPGVVLDRVIQNVAQLSWAVWWVPHNRCFLVDRAVLYKHVDQEELDVPPSYRLPETVLLLARPSADQLGGPRDALLVEYWRLLFHIGVHRELAASLPPGNSPDLRDRIENLGRVAFEEARNVLTQDGQLTANADDRTAYIEFVASYLELKYFADTLIPITFPSLPPTAAVDEVLARDVNPAELFRRTRLEGAPDPVPVTDDLADESHDYYWRLSRAAWRAANGGDTVGAAVLHTRAARVAPAALTGPAQDAARKDIYDLVTRIVGALDLTLDEADGWRKVLPSLLDKADQGNQPVEAAILFDLQRACLDHEQTIYTLDVFEWLLSGGYRPIKRPLEGQTFVRVPAHLRAATTRLAAARLTDADRQTLAGLLRDATNRAEGRLRAKFRPVLTDALHDAGMRPASVPEQASVAKTVEELLDRISAVGFLGFPDVRDAIARGQMKLPDLSGPQEYLRGDPLLRLDRRLGTSLDGVYRRSEFYTRALERLTSFNFGTENGRWVTRNVTLPFGGAFLAGQFAWLLQYEHRKKIVAPDEGADPLSFFEGWNGLWWFHALWVALGLFLLLLVRSPRVRDALTDAGRAVYRVGRTVFYDVPVRVWAHPVVKEMLASAPFLAVVNVAVKPLVLSTVLWVAVPDLWRAGWPARVVTLLAAVFVVNSRLGRVTEAVLFQAAAALISFTKAVPALVRFVNDVFRQFKHAIEFTLARAEDWLRLRGGSGPVAVAVRVAAGVVWFPVAFLLRFYTVVLIEPMLNPLKLPLSILFAKFVYPLLAVLGLFTLNPLGSPLVGDLAPLVSYPVAWAIVIGTFYLLPDAVTFLFWEMRENWRLYRANRPDLLKPVSVGPHGETIGGLLHPGFHSGTVPKLFSKLRSAERTAAATGVWRDARTHRQALREVEEGVRRFVNRDLVAVLSGGAGWGGRAVAAGRVQLGTNRIRVEFVLEGSADPAWLEWEDRSGWLVAGWAEPGWVAELADEPGRVLTDALAYLYKRAGVDLVREQLAAELPKGARRFDVVPAGVLVWYGSRDAAPVLYDLAHRADDLRPRTADNLYPALGPEVDADRVQFGRLKLTWRQWLDVWQAEQAGKTDVRFGPSDFELRLLPKATGPGPSEAGAA